MAEYEKIAEQFQRLPMEDLIGGPLMAACEAQTMLAAATIDFIQKVGFEESEGQSNVAKAKTVEISYERSCMDSEGKAIGAETVTMNVPMLNIVNIPNLMIQDVDISFDMEVKSQESSKRVSDEENTLDTSAKLGYGPFSMNVTIKGSVSSKGAKHHSGDNTAKYQVKVKADQPDMPEELNRIMDILAAAVQPTSITVNEENG